MYNEKKVVFFGSIGLAKKCLEEIVIKQKGIELLGVCCKSDLSQWRDEESVYTFCINKKIPLLSFDDILKLSPDIGISVRFDRIIPKNVIDVFKDGIFNTHGGILPEYRGSYCNVNALINGEKEYGVTLHYISEGVDSGDIVAIKKINIQDDDTGFTLYKVSEKLCYEILSENIESIIQGVNERIPQNDLINCGRKCNIYYAKNTLQKKFIEINDLKTSLNIIRAFDSPYHEPAYTLIDNKKIYLRVSDAK